MKLSLGIFAAFAMVAAIASAQSIPVVGPTTHTFSGSGQSNVWTCPNGQSSFQLTMPTGMTGTLTVTTSQSSTAPTPWPSPPIAYAPGPVFTNTLTNSGTLTLTLGSNYFINVTVSNYVSGSTTVTGSCSAAVATAPQLPVRYDIRAYGAKVNGTTDDSAAVQAAENACTAGGGGIVFFPAGTTLASGIVFYTDCQNVGSGIGTTLVKLPASANGDVFISFNFASLTGTGSNGGVFDTGFRDMAIDGNIANQSAGSGCIQMYGYHTSIAHVRIQNCFGDGLYSEWGNSGTVTPGSPDSSVVGLRVFSSGGNGVTWKGPHDSIWTDVKVGQNAGDGVKVTGNGEGLLIDGFHSWGKLQQYALYLDSGINAVNCTNCVVEGAAQAQLFIDGSNNTYSGQIYISATAAPDIVLGSTSGAYQNVINTTVETDTAQTAPILSYGNDHGANFIQIEAFCNGATPSTSGTASSIDMLIWLNDGGCTGVPPAFTANSGTYIGGVGVDNAAPPVRGLAGGAANTKLFSIIGAGGASSNEYIQMGIQSCPTTTNQDVIIGTGTTSSFSNLVLFNCEGGVGFDGVANGNTGVQVGVSNTTPGRFTGEGGSTTTENNIYNVAAFNSATDICHRFQAAGVTKLTLNCQGDGVFSGKSTSAGVRNTALASASVQSLCGGSGTDQTQCNASTNHVGQATCTVAAGVSCTATATVITATICVVAYDTATTTVTASLLLPLTESVSGTTLTMTGRSATASGNFGFNYWCP